jgi:hypothetical protein
MNANVKEKSPTRVVSHAAGAQQRLRKLRIALPAPPEPFGKSVELLRTGNLLLLRGMRPTEGFSAKFVGRVGAELNVDAGRGAARLATLNTVAAARKHLGSLDRVTQVMRLKVSVATVGGFREQWKVADAASELLEKIFGKDRNGGRSVYGVASLPLGVPVELEVIFEVSS